MFAAARVQKLYGGTNDASTWDPQYFHVDPALAAGSDFGELIASGLHTLSIYQQIEVDCLIRSRDRA